METIKENLADSQKSIISGILEKIYLAKAALDQHEDAMGEWQMQLKLLLDELSGELDEDRYQDLILMLKLCVAIRGIHTERVTNQYQQPISRSKRTAQYSIKEEGLRYVERKLRFFIKEKGLGLITPKQGRA
jgi:hypothetical protein